MTPEIYPQARNVFRARNAIRCISCFVPGAASNCDCSRPTDQFARTKSTKRLFVGFVLCASEGPAAEHEKHEGSLDPVLSCAPSCTDPEMNR
jgi:hypothetical protein